jgi:ribosomal protein S15P/S13E
MKVGQRSKLLRYLRSRHAERYAAIVQRLDLRH